MHRAYVEARVNKSRAVQLLCLTELMSVEEKRSKIESNYETIRVLRARLREVKERESKGMTRAAYIKMIFDVTKKVDKQNEELAKVVQETRKLQKDISSLSGRLGRCFTLVEETILREAKNDGWSRECYLLLNTMHVNCDQLIQAVQDTGDANRELRQLEDQIGQLRAARALRGVED